MEFRSLKPYPIGVTVPAGTTGVPDFLNDFLKSLKEGTVTFLGLLCFMAFAMNAVLLVYLLIKKSAHGLARCPKCGRVIACPHCTEDDNQTGEPPTA